MESNLRRFFIKEGRLHPGWRVTLYFIVTLASLLLVQVLIALVYVAYLTFSGLPPERLLLEVEKLPLALTLPATMMQLAVILLLTYLFRRFLDRQSFASLGFARRRGWLWEIGFGVILGFVLMGSIFLVEWAGGWLTVGDGIWRFQALGSALLMLAGYFTLFVLAGASEEIMLRGYILQNLREWSGTILAVVISSILFGLLHGFNPNFNLFAALNIALAGVAYCYAYLITGNLWLPLALHFSWNFFQGPVFSFPVSGMSSSGLLLTRVSQGGSAITGGAFGPEGGLTGLGAQLLSLLILWLWAKRRAVVDRPPMGSGLCDLIDEREVTELAQRYGPLERRHYALELEERTFAHWREAYKGRRGEVALFILRPSGKLILHAKDFYPEGVYRVPTGGIEWGEDVVTAVHREAREETGLTVAIERCLGVLEYEFHYRGETLPFVSYVFLLRENGGQLCPQDKGERITSLREVPPTELEAVARNLRAIEADWSDWGHYRAIAHSFATDCLSGDGAADIKD
jgi:membrane protease YdiL (CAAX protease family)/ADP-ribose pyrophosphatase YjhB (NUDIX family)